MSRSVGHFTRVMGSLALSLALLGASYSTTFAEEFQVREGTSVNLRNGPGTGYKKAGRLNSGSRLKELERTGDWSRVRTETGKIVWVHNGYIVRAKANNDDETKAFSLIPPIGLASSVTDIIIGSGNRFVAARNRYDANVVIWDVAKSAVFQRISVSSTSFAIEGIIGDDLYLTNYKRDRHEKWSIERGIVTKIYKFGDTSWPTDKLNENKKIYAEDVDFGKNGIHDAVAIKDRITDKQIALLFGGDLGSGPAPTNTRLSKNGKYLFRQYNSPIQVWDLDKVTSRTRKTDKSFEIPLRKYELDSKRYGYTHLKDWTSSISGNSLIFYWDRGLISYYSMTSKSVLWVNEGLLKALRKKKQRICGELFSAMVALTISDDSKLVAAKCGSDLVLIDAVTGKTLWSKTFAGGIQTLKFSDRNDLYVGMVSGSIHVFTGSREKATTSLDGAISLGDLAVLKNNSELIATSDNGLFSVNYTSFEVLLNRKSPLGDGKPVFSIFPDKLGIYTAYRNKGDVYIVDNIKGETILKIEDDGTPQKVVFSNDSTTVYVSFVGKDAGWDMFNKNKMVGYIKSYDLKRKKTKKTYYAQKTKNGNRPIFKDFDVNEESDILVGTLGLNVNRMLIKPIAARIRLSSGKIVKRYSRKRNLLYGGAVAISNDGSEYAIKYARSDSSNRSGLLEIYRSRNDKRITRKFFSINQTSGLWYRPTEKEVLYVDGNFDLIRKRGNRRTAPYLVGHKGFFGGLVEIPDKSLIATSASDGTLRLWDRDTGKERLLISIVDKENWLAITPEGFFAGTEKAAKAMRILVRGKQNLPIDAFYDTLYRPDLVLEALRGDPAGKLKSAIEKLRQTNIWDSGLPPVISDLGPMEVSTTLEKINLQFQLSVRSGGIGRVEIKVNGATQIVEDVSSDAGDANAVTVTKSVFLTPGKNQIEVTAYNKANLINSTGEAIEVVSTAKSREKPTLHILVVGVDEYEDRKITQLNYAVNDAIAIGQAFRKSASSVYENVKVTRVLNGDATKDNLDQVFNKLGSEVRPEDVFVFFLAGHGKTEDGRYYFVPPDFKLEGPQSYAKNAIGQLQWQQWMARVSAQKSVLLYDTCESGSLARDKANEGLEVTAAIDRLTRATGRTILTAATDTEPALEGYRGHGVFSYIVLEALGIADTDEDGQLEVSELASHIRTVLPKVSYEAFQYRQVPQTSISGYSFSLGTPTMVLGQ